MISLSLSLSLSDNSVDFSTKVNISVDLRDSYTLFGRKIYITMCWFVSTEGEENVDLSCVS